MTWTKTQQEVEAWMKAGEGKRLSCGRGLHLLRQKNGFSWVYRYMHQGKRRDAGLGGYSDKLKLIEAQWSIYGAEPGEDFIGIQKKEKLAKSKKSVTFEALSETYITDVGSRIWRHEKQAKEFRRVVKVYCSAIANMPVEAIGVAEVKKCLMPLVSRRKTMFAVVASVIRRVIDMAFALELRPLGVNPASESVLEKVLVVQHTTTHFASLPWSDAPAFYAQLDEMPLEGDGRSAKGMQIAALKLLMLTALRRGEILGLRWDEVDLENGILSISAKRMKAARDHIVPLSRQAADLLRRLHNQGGKFVFPSPRRKDQSLAPTAFTGLVSGNATPHGMRATFRTWAEDHGIDASLAEHALAHQLTDGVQRAYRRSTAVERRRELMQQWADYLAPYASTVTTQIINVA